MPNGYRKCSSYMARIFDFGNNMIDCKGSVYNTIHHLLEFLGIAFKDPCLHGQKIKMRVFESSSKKFK